MKVSFKNIIGVFVLMLFIFSPKSVFAEEMNDYFKQILNEENKIVITDSSIDGDKFNLVRMHISKIPYDGNAYLLVESCNADVSSCRITLIDSSIPVESYEFPIEYKEELSEDFSKILTDGYLVVTSTSLSSDSSLIFETLKKFETEEYNFQANCNEENTKCTVQRIKKNITMGGSGFLEQHIVEIKKEEKISEKFKSILTDGTFKFNTIKPSSDEELEFLTYAYLSKLSTEEYDFNLYDTNEDMTLGDIMLYNYADGITETHTVKLEFKPTDKEIKNRLDKYIKKFDSLKTEDSEGWKSFKFDLIDLEMINYYATTKSKTFDYTKLNEMFNYSQTIKDIFDGLNYTYDYDCRMGYDAPFASYAEGGLNILYDGVYYGVVSNVGTSSKNILYIPSDTEKTPEAFIKAAEKKIKDYLPNLNVKITKGATFEEYKFVTEYDVYDDVSDYIKENIDVNKTVNNVFVVDFGNFKVDFLIVADSTKEIKPEFITYDLNTNISITSKSSSIPLDTQVKIEKLSSGEEYEKILKVLNVKENDMYDIKLYSNAQNGYITKLDNGEFEVKIPIPKKLQDKDLEVYYVDKNNNIERYTLKPDAKGEYGTFTTTHFSIYTLAEKKTEVSNETSNETSNNTNIKPELPKVPETFDGVLNYVLSTILSFIVLVGTTNYLKKKVK